MKELINILWKANSHHLWKQDYYAQFLEIYHLTTIKFVSCFTLLQWYIHTLITHNNVNYLTDWNVLAQSSLTYEISVVQTSKCYCMICSFFVTIYQIFSPFVRDVDSLSCFSFCIQNLLCFILTLSQMKILFTQFLPHHRKFDLWLLVKGVSWKQHGLVDRVLGFYRCF